MNELSSILPKICRQLSLQVRHVGRKFGLHLRQGVRIGGIVQGAGETLRLKLALPHLGQCLGHPRISINRGEQQVDEFAEQIVVGFHGDIISPSRRWLDRLINDQLSSAERRIAAEQFPTLLSVFESLFKTETQPNQ